MRCLSCACRADDGVVNRRAKLISSGWGTIYSISTRFPLAFNSWGIFALITPRVRVLEISLILSMVFINF